LTLEILKAEHLQDIADAIQIGQGRKSDPYVVVEIVDHAGRKVVESTTKTPKEQTEVLKNAGGTPVWKHELFTYSLNEVDQYLVKLTVKDQDSVGGVDRLAADTLMAEATFDLSVLQGLDTERRTFAVPLTGPLALQGAVATVAVHTNRPVSPQPAPEPVVVSVHVDRAENMKDTDGWPGWKGKIDPFVTMEIIDAYGKVYAHEGKPVGKEKRTTVKSQAGANATWDESFLFEPVLHQGCKLRMHVKDKDIVGDDHLGTIDFPLEQLTLDWQPQQRTIDEKSHSLLYFAVKASRIGEEGHHQPGPGHLDQPAMHHAPVAGGSLVM